MVAFFIGEIMTERPILFNSEMVRAILDGRKTQTRRIIRPQPPLPKGSTVFLRTEVLPNGMNSRDSYACVRFWYDWNNTGKHEDDVSYGCFYGKVGDRLWVRETWQAFNKLSGSILTNGIPKVNYGGGFWVAYKADNVADPKCKWRPSIHMPKWAARIWLEVTGVRVERLTEISEEDAKAEGVVLSPSTLFPTINTSTKQRQQFPRLWNSINKKRGFSWESNPWLWVVSFKVL